LNNINWAVLIMETRCICSDVGNCFVCHLDELQASQSEQNRTNFVCHLDELQASQFEQNRTNFDWVLPSYCCSSLSSGKETSKTLLSSARKLFLCTRPLSVHCLSGKTIASPQLRAVRSHPYTSEWQLSTVVTSQVLAVRHETHDRGPFKKTSLRDKRTQLQKSLRFVWPVSNRQRKW
jgi:hypothetical protein